MTRTILAAFANRLALPDLRLLPEEKLTPSRIRIELLSGLTVALALVFVVVQGLAGVCRK